MKTMVMIVGAIAGRVEAHFNLGVLHKEQSRRDRKLRQRSARQKASAAFHKAATIRPAGLTSIATHPPSIDAKQLADDCDRMLAAIEP